MAKLDRVARNKMVWPSSRFLNVDGKSTNLGLFCKILVKMNHILCKWKICFMNFFAIILCKFGLYLVFLNFLISLLFWNCLCQNLAIYNIWIWQPWSKWQNWTVRSSIHPYIQLVMFCVFKCHSYIRGRSINDVTVLGK